MNDALLYFTMKYEGDFDKILAALRNQEKIDPLEMREYKSQVKHKYVTIMNDNYPQCIKLMNCPPMILFYKGNLSLIDTDLPKKLLALKGGKRFISTLNPINRNDHIIFDYVICAESYNDLDKLVEHIKEQGIPLKNYAKPKNRQLDR